jgi:hypothetical protein
MVSSVYFCASKLEAFGDRGRNDCAGSRDLEDLIAVVDGRAELVGEIQTARSDVRSYLERAPEHLAPVSLFGGSAHPIEH